MSGPSDNGTGYGASMFGAGAAALRKVIVNPLMRRKPAQTQLDIAFNSVAEQDQVTKVLEAEIIPQLLVAYASGGSDASHKRGSDINDNVDLNALAEMPLRLDAPNLLEEVERFLEQGVNVEQIYLHMLAPAARQLGEMWKDDTCDFVDVTMGLWRLQEVMRELSIRHPRVQSGGRIANVRSALFCPVPGDTHSFGAQMIEEVFARAGWNSEVLLNPERRELLDCVSQRSFDLVGLTVSRDCPSASLQSLIKAIRSVTANPHISILVGGHYINENPDLVSQIGADGTGIDAQSALEAAEGLVAAAPLQAIP